MKIEKVNQYPQIERLQKEDNFLSSLFNKVFLICKENKDFMSKRQQFGELDIAIDELENRDEKQNSLLEQSSSLKQNVSRKVQLLGDENFRTRAQLLESLGREI